MKFKRYMVFAALLGLLIGSFFPEWADYFNKGAGVYVQLVSMVVVLLVVTSASLGMYRLKSPKEFLKISIHSLMIFLSFAVIAVLFGVSLSWLFNLGGELQLELPDTMSHIDIPSLGEMVLAWIPTNPLASMTKANLVQILVFSAFLGIAMQASREKGRSFVDCLESTEKAIHQITSIVLNLAPLGLLFSMAYFAASSSTLAWSPAALKFLLVYTAGAAIFILVFYSFLLRFVWDLSPSHLFKGMSNAIYVAFATRSSAASLSATLQCLTEELGVSSSIASFVASMGAAFRLNGLALFHGMSVVFVAQAYGISLGWDGIATLVCMTIFVSLGMAGMQGIGLVQLYMILGTMGLPHQAVAILVIFEVIREMISTVLNVVGDTVCAVGVAKNLDYLDEHVYTQSSKMWESTVI